MPGFRWIGTKVFRETLIAASPDFDRFDSMPRRIGRVQESAQMAETSSCPNAIRIDRNTQPTGSHQQTENVTMLRPLTALTGDAQPDHSRTVASVWCRASAPPAPFTVGQKDEAGHGHEIRRCHPVSGR